MGIEVLPPDVNESGHRFVVVDGNIRFGLDAVKNVGAAAVDAVIAAREEGGPFRSLWDFCSRVDCRAVNKKAIEALIKCGAFDSTAATRTGMLSVLEQAQGAGQKTQLDAQLGQASIFDLEDPAPGAAASNGAPDLPVPALPDERSQLNAWERESLGLFLSSHPLKEVRPALRARIELSLAGLRERRDGEFVTVGGMITECKRIRTRKGDPMMFATLDDLEGQVEMLVFNSAYAANAEKVDVDKVVIVKGRVDHKEAGEVKLVAQEVEAFEPSAEEVAEAALAATAEPVVKRLFLAIEPGVPTSFLDDLKELVKGFPGDHELMLRIGEHRLLLGPDYRVSADRACRAELAALPGASVAA
jgi:DNA polymerase-3 subunit alpha